MLHAEVKCHNTGGREGAAHSGIPLPHGSLSLIIFTSLKMAQSLR